ncbi:MAG: hypothetical protein QOI52_1314, partial [Chloroflexota bacterium]|nr:hypothetical protein [Chloroflexota bacterium]
MRGVLRGFTPVAPVRKALQTGLSAFLWPGFDQRFSAKRGLDVFEGMHQFAETPGDWHDDLKVPCRRRDQGRIQAQSFRGAPPNPIS